MARKWIEHILGEDAPEDEISECCYIEIKQALDRKDQHYKQLVDAVEEWVRTQHLHPPNVEEAEAAEGEVMAAEYGLHEAFKLLNLIPTKEKKEMGK
jgi:hypothetical protein